MQPIWVVDAFTNKPFAGNPAGVCLLGSPANEIWMQQVAAEMNLSETAFAHPEGEGYRLRWFTPKVEMQLCGHATLATAHLIWEAGVQPQEKILRFQTKSGELTAQRLRDGLIELNFPALPTTPVGETAAIERALGAKVVCAARGITKLLAELASERDVRELKPDFSAMMTIDAKGVIATARAETPGYDFVSRFFAPALGINEDPVTGSAHCALGPYWKSKLGKATFLAYQASARGGEMRVTVDGDRVRLAGQAVTVLEAQLK